MDEIDMIISDLIEARRVESLSERLKKLGFKKLPDAMFQQTLLEACRTVMPAWNDD